MPTSDAWSEWYLLYPPGLSLIQWSVFLAIHDGARDCGYQPSFAEIAEKTGEKSASRVRDQVEILVRQGWLDWPDVSSKYDGRAMRILRRPDGTKFEGFAEKD